MFEGKILELDGLMTKFSRKNATMYGICLISSSTSPIHKVIFIIEFKNPHKKNNIMEPWKFILYYITLILVPSTLLQVRASNSCIRRNPVDIHSGSLSEIIS